MPLLPHLSPSLRVHRAAGIFVSPHHLEDGGFLKGPRENPAPCRANFWRFDGYFQMNPLKFYKRRVRSLILSGWKNSMSC